MRTQLFAFAMTAGIAFGTSTSSAGAADQTKPKLHTWSSIQYGSLACPWATGYATASLHDTHTPQASGIENGLHGLQFRLTFHRSDRSNIVGIKTGKPVKAPKFKEPEPEKIVVRLHLRDGTVVKPLKRKLPPDTAPEEAKVRARVLDLNDNFIIWLSQGPGGYVGMLTRTFPTGKNSFDEAWIEVRFPGHAYWLEVPYGLARNAKDTLCASAQLGRPRFAKAMKNLEKNARIVNWLSVAFEFGKIQNGWRLTLVHSNRLDANSEIVLGRFDGINGKSSLLWRNDTTRTRISIEDCDAHVAKGRRMSIRQHRYGITRSDTFKFNRNTNSKARSWGTVTITVGDKKYNAVMPSSLFRYKHGFAERSPKTR